MCTTIAGVGHIVPSEAMSNGTVSNVVKVSLVAPTRMIK